MCKSGPEPNSVAERHPGPPDFEAIYIEFQPRIRRYLSRLVGRSEADDLAQEVFAKVSQALPGFRGDSRVSTWVYRIATNTAFDRMRSPEFQRARELAPGIPEPMTGRSSGIEQALARTEMNTCLRRYIDALPTGYRSVLLLSEDEGLTNQQIAEALGLTLDTVKIRLHRARARLRARLGSGCDLYRDEGNELPASRRGAYPRVADLRLYSRRKEVGAMKLDARTTELIAIGASVTANCLSCLEYHVGKATESGVDGDEITQAIDVGTMVRRGAAGKMDKLVENLRRSAPSGVEAPKAACCG